MNTIKHFQYLRFPWRFNVRSSQYLMPTSPEFEDEVEPLKEGFMFAIQETMKGIVGSNFDYLSKVMEPNLYQEFLEGMNTIERRGHKLSLVNQDTFAFVYLFNEEVHCGVNVERSLNTKDKYKISNVPKITRKNQKISLDNIHFYGGGDWESHIILKLDVIFNSPCKFVVFDENQEVIVGENSMSPENHIFRFETVLKRPNGLFFQFKSSFDVFRYFVLSYGKNPLTFDNWIITDIDNFLKTSPYLPEQE